MKRTVSSLSILRKRGSLVWFFANFAAAKAGIYLAPLAIAAFTTASVYGAIEFGLAVALMAASALTGAQFSGINQRYLVGRDHQVDDELALWTGLGCALALLLWWVGGVAGLSLAWQIALASIGIAVVHNAASTWARMRGARVLTAWADGTATFVAGGLILSLVLFDSADSERAVGHSYAGLLAVAAIAAALLFLKARTHDLRRRLVRSWQIGLPMLANSVLATWQATNGRVFVGFFASESLAVYGLMFRVAGLGFAVSQLAITAYFATLYAARTKEADRLLAPFLIAVTVLLAGLSLVAPLLVPIMPIAALNETGRRLYAEVFPVVALQIFFWISFAMLQLRINRSGLARRAFLPMLLVTFVGTALTLFIGWLGNVSLMCWSIAAQSASLFAVEWIVLARARLPHVRMGWIGLCGGLSLTGIALVNQFFRTSV
jgi:hypothetical protein